MTLPMKQPHPRLPGGVNEEDITSLMAAKTQSASESSDDETDDESGTSEEEEEEESDNEIHGFFDWGEEEEEPGPPPDYSVEAFGGGTRGQILSSLMSVALIFKGAVWWLSELTADITGFSGPKYEYVRQEVLRGALKRRERIERGEDPDISDESGGEASDDDEPERCMV